MKIRKEYLFILPYRVMRILNISYITMKLLSNYKHINTDIHGKKYISFQNISYIHNGNVKYIFSSIY